MPSGIGRRVPEFTAGSPWSVIVDQVFAEVDCGSQVMMRQLVVRDSQGVTLPSLPRLIMPHFRELEQDATRRVLCENV